MHSMHYQNDYMYLVELLSQPTVHRCAELGLLIDQCNLKDLQHFFPQLVASIFGNASTGSTGSGAVSGAGPSTPIGWGLRTITGYTDAHEFDVLYSFFIPMGPMFRLCYRLLNESMKFDVSLDVLPTKMADMLYSGRYPAFYAGMVNVDPSIRQITSLSLNAFDYFILHFALHGLHPLHLLHPAALDVHNEKRKTLYIYLVADYMCSFMPSHPDAVVMPSNVGGTMNMTNILTPIQPSLPPARSPKYIKLSALSLCGSPATPGAGGPATPMAQSSMRSLLNTSLNDSALPAAASTGHHHAAHDAYGTRTAWRTESVLNVFVDTWLRCDVTEHLELPSSEFLRSVRILIKQLHAFANSAHLDHTPMAGLRYAVHPLINATTYNLLCALIRRWPLDSSFSVVLELWLSYIQPWRYTFDLIHGANEATGAAPVRSDGLANAEMRRRFEPFVKENMRAYTQILVQLLPRFERLNFSSLKNVLMMNRLLKVFAQSHLVEMLRAYEFDVYATISFMASSSPNKQSRSPYRMRTGADSPSAMLSASLGSNASAVSGGIVAGAPDGDSTAGGTSPHASGYVCMFGEDVQRQIRHIGERMLIAGQIERDRAAYLQADTDRRHGDSLWRRLLRWIIVCDEDTAQAQMLTDSRKIPELLDDMLQLLRYIFDVDLADLPPTRSAADVTHDYARNSTMLLDETDHNRSLDISLSFSNATRAPNGVPYTVDPALVPAKSYELAFLVRFLYQLTSKLNIMYHREMQEYWNRRDMRGRIARQLLSAPLIVHSFDKSDGVSRVCEQRLQPRLNLRPLASYQALLIVGVSFIIGQLWYGVPSFGFIGLLLLIGVYVLIVSLLRN